MKKNVRFSPPSVAAAARKAPISSEKESVKAAMIDDKKAECAVDVLAHSLTHLFIYLLICFKSDECTVVSTEDTYAPIVFYSLLLSLFVIIALSIHDFGLARY